MVAATTTDVPLGVLLPLVMALIGALWVMLQGKIDGIKKEVHEVNSKTITREEFAQHVESDERVQGRIASDLEEHRDTFAKLFDQLREVQEKSHERHVELLNAIYERMKNKRGGG